MLSLRLRPGPHWWKGVLITTALPLPPFHPFPSPNPPLPQPLKIYYLKNESWQIGMNETVYWKAFKRNSLFSFSFKSFQLFESNVLSFSIFPLNQPGINIAHNAHGHYGKIGPRVLASHSARYIFTSSSHIIVDINW